MSVSEIVVTRTAVSDLPLVNTNRGAPVRVAVGEAQGRRFAIRPARRSRARAIAGSTVLTSCDAGPRSASRRHRCLARNVRPNKIMALQPECRRKFE